MTSLGTITIHNYNIDQPRHNSNIAKLRHNNNIDKPGTIIIYNNNINNNNITNHGKLFVTYLQKLVLKLQTSLNAYKTCTGIIIITITFNNYFINLVNR